MANIWNVKRKRKCRDCGKMTASIIVSDDNTQVFTFCSEQKLNVYPDVEHFCDDFVKCEFDREGPKVQEREIATADGIPKDSMKFKEGHEKDPGEITEDDIVGVLEADGKIHPMSEYEDKKDEDEE